MPSRFKGRDFKALRSEIVDYVREKSPAGWNYNNSADPMIRIVEAIAMMGDHLHYYIDAMRREADLSTASLASSVYSFALKEGYSMLLTMSNHARINLYSDGEEIPGLTLAKFHPYTSGNRQFYCMKAYEFPAILSSYTGDVPSVEVVEGTIKELTFSYSDIDMYSRYELPDSKIDSSCVSLVATHNGVSRVLTLSEDVLSEVSQKDKFSLKPSFINGVEKLYLVFPFTYTNLFPRGTQFTLQYIVIINNAQPQEDFFTDIEGVVGTLAFYGGYREWETPESIKTNYKRYVRDFTALLTKSDYSNFISYMISSRNRVLDISDNYNNNFSGIPPRTIFCISDLTYVARETLRAEILLRSSRSDNVLMIPYGKHLYRIFTVVLSDYRGTNTTTTRSSIETRLKSLYNDITEERLPVYSAIHHEIHSLGERIQKVYTILISEYDHDGNSNFPSRDICDLAVTDPDQLTTVLAENGILKFFYDLLPLIDGVVDTSFIDNLSECKPPRTAIMNEFGLKENVSVLERYHGTGTTASFTYDFPRTLPYTDLPDIKDVVLPGTGYYDKEDIDQLAILSPEYSNTHFMMPSLYDTIVWVY